MNTSALKTQIKRISLVDSVYETLLEAIVSGSLAPGSDLNSVDLARQLEVSRTPVKEAIKLLTHDGLAEQVNNHRARVASFSRQEIVEIYDVRKLLEMAAAERAARLIGDEELQGLRQDARALLRSQRSVAWAAQAIEYDIRFHQVVAAASGNRRLRKEVERYRLLVRGFCRMTGRKKNLLQALKEHVEILDALATRRPSSARRAMGAHIDARLTALLNDLDAAKCK